MMSISRGGAAAARPTAWMSGKFCSSEIVADDRAHAWRRGGRERARGLLELRRAHVVGRRVDEIAGEAHALDDAAEIVAVDVAGEFELDVLRLRLAVAREAVAAEREGERRQAANRAGHWRSGRRPPEGARAARPGRNRSLLRIVGALEREQDPGRARLPAPAAAGAGRPSARSRRPRRRRVRANRVARAARAKSRR